MILKQNIAEEYIINNLVIALCLIILELGLV